MEGWVEQNVLESANEDGGFDWERYQYLCDTFPEWDSGFDD